MPIKCFERYVNSIITINSLSIRTRTLCSWRHFYATQDLERGVSTHALSRQLGQRLLAFYAPELLSNDQKSRFTEFLQARWKVNGSDVKWNTIDNVSADLSEMDTEFNSDEWKSFYNARLAHIGLSATL